MPDILTFITLQGPFEEINRHRERALMEFTKQLIETEEDNLLQVVLFGSVARGDDRQSSDIDVFVLLRDGERQPTSDRISDLAYDIDISAGGGKTRLAPFVYTLGEYKESKKAPVFWDIEDEGIVLYDSDE